MVFRSNFLLSTDVLAQMCSVKKLLLKLSQNYQENTSVEVSFLIKLFLFLIKFIKKETPALVLSFEFYETLKACNFINKETQYSE